jgi:Gas vesicle synthesis protein GvpO
VADTDNGTSTDPREWLSAKELTTIAKETIADLTGFPPESVSGLQWDGENWLVTVDVCELERIPSTTDVMATYVVQLDERGGVIGYKRARRYIRSQAEED